MDPNPVFNRRPNHNNTPESVTLIITNFIVFACAIQFFAACDKINSLFWVVSGALIVYNVFNIRKYRETYGKPQIIAYVISVAVLIVLFLLMHGREQNC